MNQPVLVTGVAGFIGSHLVKKLLQTGHTVVGLDNFDTYYPVSIKRNNINLLQGQGNFQLIEGDIRDENLLDRIFRDHQFRSVFHLAARAGVRPSVEYPLLYQDVNVTGTINLLQACRKAGVERMVFTSSSSVYGMKDSVPFKEDANVNQPVSPYAASKAAAELFCRTYYHLFGLSVIVLRLFTVYGPRQRPEMAIHKFTRQVDNAEEVDVFGDGSTVRDYTYVEDIVSGCLAALDYQGEGFQIFNLGGGRAVSLSYLLETVEKTLNKVARVRHVEPMPGDVPATFADISKARSLLGYEPKVSIEEGVYRFVRWYRENKEH